MEDFTNKNKHPQVSGTGWSFPPTFSPNAPNGLVLSAGNKDIQESLEILFGTRKGERLMHARLGTNLRDYLLLPMTSSLESSLKEEIQHVILLFEPRIKLLNLEVNSLQEQARIEISLTYMTFTNNSRHNLVFPFYLAEGEQYDI